MTAGVLQKYTTGWTIFKHQVDNRNMNVSGWPQARAGQGDNKPRRNNPCCSWGIKANLNPCYMESLQYTMWGPQTNDNRDKVSRGIKRR